MTVTLATHLFLVTSVSVVIAMVTQTQLSLSHVTDSQGSVKVVRGTRRGTTVRSVYMASMAQLKMEIVKVSTLVKRFQSSNYLI